MEPITKHCPIEGLTENHFTIATFWTRGDFRDYYRLQDDKFLEVYRRKVTAIYLETADGDAIETPAEMTDERLDQVDYVLWRWFGTAFREALLEMQRLGEAKAQQSFPSTEEKNGSAQS